MSDEQSFNVAIRAVDMASAVFDIVRQKASDTFSAVKTSAVDGLGNVEHAAESMRDKLTEAFESPTGAIHNLGNEIASALGPIGAIGALGITAIGGITAAIVDLGMKGAEIADVQHGFEGFAGSVEKADAIMQAMRTGVHGTLSDFALQTDALHLMSAGVKMTAADYGTLTSASLVLAHEGFGTTKDILDQLTGAMITGRTKVVERMTGVLDAKEAEGQFATSLGVSTNELSKAGQAEAKREEIMTRLRAVVEQAGEQELSFKDRIDQMRTAMDNATDSLKVAIATSPVLNTALEAIGTGIEDALGASQVQTVQTMVHWINQGAIELTGLAEAGITTGKYLTMTFYGVRGALFEVLAAVTNIVTAVLEGNAKVSETLASMPLIGSHWQAEAVIARNAADLFGTVADSFKRTGDEAFASMTAAGVGFDSANAKVESLRQKMIAAGATEADVAKIINALGAAHDVNGDKMKAAADKYLKVWESTETELETLWNRQAAAEASASDKGLQARLATLAKQEADEDAKWAAKLEKGTATQTQYEQAIYSIHQYFLEQGAKLTQDAADKEAAKWQKNEDDIQKIRDAAFSAEQETGVKGLELQLAMLDRQEAAEKEAWQKKLDAGTVSDEQYWEAISAIDDKFNASRTAKTVTWEEQKWKAIGDIENQAFAAEQQLAGDSEQAKLAANERELQAKIATLTAEQKMDADYMAALQRLYADKAELITQSFDPIAKAWKAINADMRQTWADTWTQALSGTGSFVDALLSPFKQLEQAWMRLLGAMVADYENQFIAKIAGINIAGGGFSGGYGGGASGGGGGVNISSLFNRGGGSSGGEQVITESYDANGNLIARGSGGGGGSAVTGMSRAGMGATVGAGVAGSILTGIASDHKGEMEGHILGTAGGALSGAATGAMIGSIIPGIGTAIGAGVGAIVGGIKGFIESLGPSKAEVAGRQSEASFEDKMASSLSDAGKAEAGPSKLAQAVVGLREQYVGLGMDAAEANKQANDDMAAMLAAEKQGSDAVAKVQGSIGDRARALAQVQAETKAGVDGITSSWQHAGQYIPQDIQASIQQLLQMKGLTDAEKASLQGLADGAKPAFTDLMNVASKYNLTLSQLGPSFQEKDLEGKAKSLLSDFTELQQNGADVNGLFVGMGKQFQDLVNESQQTGAKIPDNLKPILDQMTKNGLLVDQNGNKLKDISQLSFEATPLDSSLKTLNDQIQALLDKLNAVPGAAAAAGSAAGGVTLPGGYKGGGNDMGLPPGSTVTPEAAGDFGTVYKPTLFLAGEAGPEQVAFSGANKTFTSGSLWSGAPQTKQTIIQGGINLTVYAAPGDLKDPQAFGDKLREWLRGDSGLIRTTFETIVDDRITAAAGG